MESLDVVSSEIIDAIATADSLDVLEAIRIDALGKKGRISLMMRELGRMNAEDRRAAGQTLNKAKDDIATAIDAKQKILATAVLNERLEAERLDVSLPSRPEIDARLHPLSQTIEEVIAIFAEMGFQVAEGPDIESDYYNFTALNIPAEHPARQEHDTFYLPADAEGRRKVLRTHTSPVQIRTMMSQKPPIRIIAPGATYRCDSDMTHTPMFHQVEALYVAERVSFAELRAELQSFLEAFFNTELKLRFRPSYFPFTEPSAEVDIDGRSLGTGSGWMEVLGCGMVHPRVLEAAGIDGERYTGYAIGMGVERLAMLRHGVTDLRQFYENDLRFLSQFV